MWSAVLHFSMIFKFKPFQVLWDGISFILSVCLFAKHTNKLRLISANSPGIPAENWFEVACLLSDSDGGVRQLTGEVN